MAEIKDVGKSIKQANKIIKDVDVFSDKLKKGFDKIKNVAIDKAIELNNSKTPFKASSLVAISIDKQFRKVIKDSSKTFSDFTNELEDYLSQNFAIKLSKRDLKAIANKKSYIIDSLTTNTTILKQDIQSILTQNLAKGVPERQLIAELKDLYPAFSRNSSTLVNTGLSRLFTDTNISKFRGSGFNWYIWAGPDDSITRDIPCKHWVRHKFPASQLNTLTATKMTLWNCRHNIIPIPDEEADNYPTGSIGLAK